MIDEWDQGGFGPPPAGHNKPPAEEPASFVHARDMLKQAQTIATEILTIKTAAEADKVADTLRGVQGAVDELELHRTVRVGPLNRRVAAINDEYRPLRQALENLVTGLKTISRNWLLAQDKLRGERARLAREEAERLAKEAEDKQRQASEEAERAKDGDVTDGPLRPVEAALDASQATLAARKAEAKAAAIEKARPKSGGGFGKRAVHLRTEERLSIATLKDLLAAVREMGLREDLVEAVLKEARAYRAERSKLPKGITSVQVKV